MESPPARHKRYKFKVISCRIEIQPKIYEIDFKQLEESISICHEQLIASLIKPIPQKEENRNDNVSRIDQSKRMDYSNLQPKIFMHATRKQWTGS